MNTRRAPRATPSAWSLFLFCAAATGLVGALSTSGCDDQRPTLTPTSGEGGSGGQGGSTTSSTTEDKGQQLFDDLVTDMMDACGTCHDAGGFADTPFLREPRYESITSWPGIITKDPAASILVTHAITGGGHGGTNLDSAALKNTLLPKVQAWLTEESKAIADTPEMQKGKSVDPFAPILGFNAVYLTAISAEFTGMAITFNANELTPTSLELTNVEVHTTAKMGIHLVHPLFSVYPKGGNPNPDPADSFSNVDQYIDYGKSDTLGPGTLILTNWVADGKLQISFEDIEKYTTMEGTGGAGGGTVGGGGCKDLDSFTTNAKGQFAQCLQCHGGANGQATAAVDMTGLVNDADVDQACGQIRNRISPEDPPSSQLFITTDPGGNAAHPYKFGQNQNAFNGFKNAVSIWIAAEK